MPYPWILVVGKPFCDSKLARKSAERLVSTKTRFLFAPKSKNNKDYYCWSVVKYFMPHIWDCTHHIAGKLMFKIHGIYHVVSIVLSIASHLSSHTQNYAKLVGLTLWCVEQNLSRLHWVGNMVWNSALRSEALQRIAEYDHCRSGPRHQLGYCKKKTQSNN